jgi:hypothetical protein
VGDSSAVAEEASPQIDVRLFYVRAKRLFDRWLVRIEQCVVASRTARTDARNYSNRLVEKKMFFFLVITVVVVT